MNINSLKAFIRLSENGCDFSIHRELGIARSSLWTLIDELEKETGLSLIIRRKRHNSFTEQAERLLPFLREVVQVFEAGLEEAGSSFSGVPSGEILIATTSAVSNSFLMNSIKKFGEMYPNIRVKVISGDYISSSTEWMADIVFRPIDIKDHLERRWYISSQCGLYASQEYLQKHGTPTSHMDLLNHSMIGYGETQFSYFSDVDWHIKGRWGDLPRINPIITINSTTSIYIAALHGIGICSSTDQSIKFYDSYKEKLVRVLPHIDGPIINTYFSVKRNMGSKLRNNVEIFQQFLEDYFQKIGIMVHKDEYEATKGSRNTSRNDDSDAETCASDSDDECIGM